MVLLRIDLNKGFLVSYVDDIDFVLNSLAPMCFSVFFDSTFDLAGRGSLASITKQGNSSLPLYLEIT